MHPDYATSLGNIGNIYLSEGDYDKALEYKLKSIEVQKIVLG
jgi:tetratricopeptide (TPR) repeat protein